MPDEFTNKAIEELAKQLPAKEIYNDAGSPAAKQAGYALEDVMKTLRLALAPVQLLGALQDRYSNFLDHTVRKIPEDRRILPPPQILGPVLEGIRYEVTGSDIETMFSELLSAAMDVDRVGSAHPAFVKIIGELAPDEARLIAHFYANGASRRIFTMELDYSSKPISFKPDLTLEKDDFPRSLLQYPDRAQLYLTHLSHLGLTSTDVVRVDEPIMEPAPASGGSQSEREPFARSHRQFGVRRVEETGLTAWGKAFADACTRRQPPK